MMQKKIKGFWKEKVATSDFRAQNEKVALYEHLDGDDKETRLVTLKQGRFSDPIYCSLSKVSLEDALQYQALSYTWGDLDSVCQIYLNERLYPITRNLESALRHLRYVDKPRILWIDALCINQKDTLERNSQVMQMNSIFKQAFEVVAWLGDEDEDSNLVFDAFEALPKDSSIHWNSAAPSMFQKVLTDRKYGIAIRKFLRRSWWNRVWTAQESVLARTLHFVCGHRQISADALLTVCDCFFIHLKSESCCYGTFQDFVKRTAEAFHSLETLKLARSVAHRGNRIEDLIADYRTRHCTDPRDKIYGLLGMTRSEDSKVIVPNYSIPVSEVYEQVALQLIIHTRSLNIFSQLYRPGIAETPSWVPDWTAELGHNQSRALAIRFEMIHHYWASSGSFSCVRSIGQGKLTLHGILFGSCRVFSEPNSGKHYRSDYNNDTYKFWPDLAGITTNPSRPYANSNFTTYYDAYWQTLCASLLADISDLGGVKKARTSDRSFYQSWYEAWWNSPRPSSKSRIDQNTLPSNAASANPANSDITRAQIECFGNFVETATSMRKLFISEEGWLGLAPMDAEVGDRIALLEGGNVPYIVRQKNFPGNEWEIIGDAYVHGIMDGQGWKLDQLVDIVLV